MDNGLQIILEIAILASAFPAGYLLSYLCRDELKMGRKWFRGITAICIILALILAVFYRNAPIILTLDYIAIVALISVRKSYDSKFVSGK